MADNFFSVVHLGRWEPRLQYLQNITAVLVCIAATEASAELLNVHCTGNKSREAITLEYVLDTTGPLRNFIGKDIGSWSVSGSKPLAVTKRSEQVILDGEVKLVGFNAELVDQQELSCPSESVEVSTVFPNNDTFADLTKNLKTLRGVCPYLRWSK